jgi:hypothetical protein
LEFESLPLRIIAISEAYWNENLDSARAKHESRLSCRITYDISTRQSHVNRLSTFRRRIPSYRPLDVGSASRHIIMPRREMRALEAWLTCEAGPYRRRRLERRQSGKGEHTMTYHDKIQLTIIIIAPPDQAEEGDRIFRSHAPWMEATHHRTGSKALLTYNVSKAPELSNPMDFNSARQETRASS